MKILIDTNVIIDVLTNRMPFAEHSAAVLKLCECKTVEGFITATTITDIYYILCKHISDKTSLYIALEKLLSIVNVCDVTKHNVFNAIALRQVDFEDAIQADCAKVMNADFIVTRNIKDFVDSQVRAVTPGGFLGLI